MAGNDRMHILVAQSMAGLRGFHLLLLSTVLLFVAGGSPVVSGQSTGELSTVVCSKS